MFNQIPLAVYVPKDLSKDTQTANQTATPENKGWAWTHNEYHAIWMHTTVFYSSLDPIFVFSCASN